MTASAAATAASDKRGSARHPVLGKAEILLPEASLPCTIQDCSVSGLRIAVPRAAALPQEFGVLFPASDLRLRVRLRWRRGDAIGVSFSSPELARDLFLRIARS